MSLELNDEKFFMRWTVYAVSMAAGISSTIAIDRYTSHDSVMSDLQSTVQELSRSLAWTMRNMAKISELDGGEDSRLREAIGTAAEPMRVLQEQLAREGIPTERFESLSSLRPSRIPQLLADPPPLIFLFACIFYTLSIVNLRNIHKADRYQDRILAVGCAFGVARALISQDPFQGLKGSMAWSAFLSLVLSSLFHRLLRLRLDPDVPAEREKAEIEREKGQLSVGA